MATMQSIPVPNQHSGTDYLPAPLRPSLPPYLRPCVPESLRPCVPSSIHPSVRPSLRPSIPLCLRPSMPPSLGPSVPPSPRPSVPPSLRPSVPPSLRPSVPQPLRRRVSNDTDKMCGAHARHHQVCGVSCRGLSEGQLGIGCSIPGQNRKTEKRLIPTRLLDQSEWAGQTAS